MSLNGEPVKLEQVPASLFVAKRPAVLSIQVECPKVALSSPFDGFIRMHPLCITERLMNHPAIQFSKQLFCYRDAEVVSPSTNDGVHLLENGLDVGSLYLFPAILKGIPQILH